MQRSPQKAPAPPKVDLAAFDAACKQFLIDKKVQNQAKKAYESGKKSIVGMMEPAHTFESNKYIAAFTNNPKTALNQEMLKEKYPEVYKDCLGPQDCWSLNVTEK